eukprot:scaffold2230_cov187-Amphora_coffeaeformis.AAC.14
MFTDIDTITNAKRLFDDEVFNLRKDAREIRYLHAYGRNPAEKRNAVYDILQRTHELERGDIGATVMSTHDEHLWHNLNEVIRSKANLTLLTNDPTVNDQLDGSIRKLEEVFEHEFSEASDHTE